MSIAVCLLMITSISIPFTQNVGQSQNLAQSGPSPTSGGSGGLADSPWPMFRQNLNHTGLSPYDTSGNNGQLKWSFKTIGNDYIDRSSPAIDYNGTIYIGSTDPSANNGYLYAIHPNGTEKWHFKTGNGIYSSSPAIDSEGTIYIGSDDHKLYAINQDGSEKWNFITGESIWSSPAVGFDGTIYIGSNDNKLYAINPDGTEKWIFPTGHSVESSPVIGSDGTIYVGSNDNYLYAINPDGSEKWKYSTGHGVCLKSPAIDNDGIIYIASGNALFAINTDGTGKWKHGVGINVRSPAIGPDGTIYFSSETENIHAISPSGTEKWRFPLSSAGDSIPSIGSDGTLYVGSDYNNLYAINSDGTEKWHFITPDGVESSPAIDSDGTIYVGCNDGKLYAIGTPPNLTVNVTSHFSELNSAAQSAITVHVTDGTNPVQGATVNLVSDNGGIFSPQSGITDTNGDFKSIFNAPTVTSQMICRISAEAIKTGYNDGSGYVDVTINPIPWSAFSQNSRRTGLSPYDTSSNPGKLKWSFPTGAIIQSSPVVGSDETIYFGSWDNNLYAINPDGTEKWNFTLGYIRAPAIGSDGTIYAGSLDHNLYAINPDGTEKWRLTTEGGLESSPVIGSEGTIYITATGIYKLYAINPNGTLKWGFTTLGWLGSPAIGYDGTIYVGSSDKNLYAINPDGTERWRFTASDNVASSPAIDSDGTIYVGSFDHNLYALYPNGTEKWRFTTGDHIGWHTSAAIGSNNTIYIGSDDYNLYAINHDGSEKWRFATDSLVQVAPAIGSDGMIYVGSSDNNLYAINPDGTEKWKFTTGWFVHTSPAIGYDGTIYVGSWDGNLYAIGEGGIPPIANAGPDQTVNEGDTVQFDATSSNDPNGTIESYDWDFEASDGLWWDTGAVLDATGPTPIHTYGDDGVFVATLRVTDNDNLSTTDTCNVTVENVDPTVIIESITMDVEIGLRIAGRKWNDVSMTLYEEGIEIGNGSIERTPGSPNDQIAWIPVSINFSKSYNATVTYTPEDPPNIGGNPVWIYIKSKDGSINKIHHTFNVQQSKERDSNHWNHVEPWEVDLNPHLIGLPFEITSHITDPGSDDENLTFTYGSQVKTVTYLNDPPNPDPYPSPEVNPEDIMDTTTLVYEGPGTLMVTVEDDDGGFGVVTLGIS